ncbi:efflux RND transporter permease subunit [Nitratifractor sp.]
MFSLFFIDRPIVAKVLLILIVLVGLIALKVLLVAQFPEIVPPTIQVVASYTGASADVVEESVTRPIEEQLSGIEGAIYTESISSSDGASVITVYFKPGYDLDTAAVDVQNRVSLATPRLPEAVKRTGVSTIKSSSNIVQIVSVRSTNPKHGLLYLSNFAALNLMEELKRIPGVGQVKNLGERKYALRIWIDPDKLSALGLTVNDVAAALRSQSVQTALGKVGDTALTQQGRFQYTLVAKTRLSDLPDFGRVILKTRPDGSQVRLRDVARIELGSESYLWSAYYDNKPAALLGIYQLPGANALDVAKRVKAKLEELKKRFPKEIVVEPSYDTTRFVEVSIEEVVQTLLEALALVLIVVFLFLQSFRATIVPAVAIPVSLIGTFAVLLVAGFSINTLTLFGLILAIGIVVDAILVVENVEANLEKNPDLSVKEATRMAMKEISAPIVSTTLVLLAVFVPVTFIPGISGALYKQFAMTIAFSVLISALVALTLSPAMAATILRKSHGKKNPFFRWFNAALEGLKERYDRVLRVLIRHWYIPVGGYLLLLGATWWVFKTLPTGFLPEEDQGTLVASVNLEPGTRLHDTEAVTKKVVSIIRKDPAVEAAISINGFNGIMGTLDSSTSAIFVVLKDWKERETPELSVPAIIARLEKQFKAQIPDATVRLFSPPSIPGLSATGGFEFKLENLEGMPLKDFEAKARAFIAELSKDERIASVYTMFNSNYPQLRIDIDRDKVAASGVKLSDLLAVLGSYLGSLYVDDFTKFSKNYRIFVQVDEKYRAHAGMINRFYVRNAKGDLVPLGSLVRIEKTAGPSTITHFDGYQSIAVNGVHDAAKGYSSADAIAAIEEHAAKLPPGIGIAYSGVTLQEKEAGNAAVYIFALSLLMVFLFLSAQYESWIIPLSIMLPIPAVMAGALGANMLAGLLNDIYTQIGLVLLIAMASKNAILVVEFAKELREKGAELIESAVSAGKLRMRAILMTAFAFLLGIWPLVTASGAGAASRRSLGTAVFGGMALSTLLTFMLTPVLFVLFERLRERFKGGRADA